MIVYILELLTKFGTWRNGEGTSLRRVGPYQWRHLLQGIVLGCFGHSFRVDPCGPVGPYQFSSDGDPMTLNTTWVIPNFVRSI